MSKEVQSAAMQDLEACNLEAQTQVTDAEETRELSVEESFAKLDEMVRFLESEESSIEDSFRIYQDGMKLLKKVSETLDGYEKKMQILTEDGVLEDF